MHWSWQDYEDTPKDVIDVLLDLLIEEEAERKAKEEQAAFFKSKGV